MIFLMTKSNCYWVLLFWATAAVASRQAQEQELPQLNGRHFDITAVAEPGFLDIHGDADSPSFSGYLIDMMEALALPERANFSFTLHAPTGFGAACNPRLNASETDNVASKTTYRTQYNCGTSDVYEQRSDMYLGLYYVTPGRQLLNQFTIPFLPPTSGTLAMFGTATHIAGFEDLAAQQQLNIQKPACGPAGTALIDFVETAYPGLKVKGINGGQEAIFQSFESGECDVYIVDGPIAAQSVLQFSRTGRCLANEMVRAKVTSAAAF